MNPFYQDEWATLYCADSLSVLPAIEKESLGLVVTDPPYGVNWQSNTRAERFDTLANDAIEDRPIVQRILGECVRVVGQNRHLYIFGPLDMLTGLKVAEPVELIWDKGTLGSGDMTSAWGPQHERISFTVSKFRHAGKAGKSVLPARVRKGSILRYTRPTGRAVRHPSEKPVTLLRELIESSSRQGETVLDPFAGIASTGVAATLLARKSILVELDQKYAEIGAERLATAAAIAREASAA